MADVKACDKCGAVMTPYNPLDPEGNWAAEDTLKGVLVTIKGFYTKPMPSPGESITVPLNYQTSWKLDICNDCYGLFRQIITGS